MPDDTPRTRGVRTFIAIELDEAIRVALRTVQDRLKRQVPPGSVKWVAPDGIHLTLKFLGDTPVGRIPDIEAALRTACERFGPFDLSVEGRGCFPNFRLPRVVWVAVRERGGTLSRLQEAVERTVSPLGWPTEGRAFSPHLTLGRVAKDADSRTAAAVGQAVEKSVVEQIGLQTVTAVSMIRSELRPTGAVYSRLLDIPLAMETNAVRGS
jgi:RNA 2',3'-cyclic 3'-phosphodiesterase